MSNVHTSPYLGGAGNNANLPSAQPNTQINQQQQLQHQQQQMQQQQQVAQPPQLIMTATPLQLQQQQMMMSQKTPIDDRIDRLMSLNTELMSLVTLDGDQQAHYQRSYQIRSDIQVALRELQAEIIAANLQSISPIYESPDYQLATSTQPITMDLFQKQLTTDIIQKQITQWDTVFKEKEKLTKNIDRVKQSLK
ncbi:hypothetical protein PPL_02434 [Heterostelium album PN500]|uniref:Uncharacterized protein n=1 Tax=Heterostelium pallidum (strain ATCC 26659 / Pp 5 / PN500) TaxID=670386 RepID=D3AZQ0_HETP5|nr:hypothetical protein PPL_02434 [Heterostelium album PN500]EFA85429.1 hypothetical protein PPL_02434 [Heterostelium album PN500]|eukprot:XP_020437538.1 hypothetical protein PPL_02434 [Heterostelium album PN500]